MEAALCLGLARANAGCEVENGASTSSPHPRNPGAPFLGLRTELMGLSLCGPNWGRSRALEEKALSEPGRWEGPGGHTQAADPHQPRVQSWALGLSGRWSHQLRQEEGAAPSWHRKTALWDGLGPSALCYGSSGRWCPVPPRCP